MTKHREENGLDGPGETQHAGERDRKGPMGAGGPLAPDLPEGPKFELTGGELCLDFANTVDSRPSDEPEELLNSYGDLLSWSLQKEVIPKDAAADLWKKASLHPRASKATLREALALREAIFEVFSAAAREVPPPTDALEVLNRRLPGALGHLRLGLDDSAYRWEWEQEVALDRMLWPVIRSAAELLTSDRLDRVRICSAGNCDWLFLDQSKNRSRRWCDMGVCGNRSKVRRFREAQASSQRE